MTSRAEEAVPTATAIAARIPEVTTGVGPSREAIAAAVATIAKRFRPERIVLYGSRAYGTPTAESDADLLVVMETARPIGEQTDLVRRVIPARGSSRLHVLVRTPRQVRIGLAEQDFFFVDAIERGVTLFEADAGVGRNGGVADGSGDWNEADGGSGVGAKRATDDWITKAESDYRGAGTFLALGRPEFGLTCSLSQQSAEKYLKAFLQERGVRPPRTHQLDLLAEPARRDLPDLTALREALNWLGDDGIDVRYPGVVAGRAEAERAFGVATEVRRLVRAALGVPDDGD